jgi:hypothetical protein
MMMRRADTLGFEDPPRNGIVIAQVVLEQLGVPAGGPAAAVGVVAVASGQATAVGQAPELPVAGVVAGIAFNAQAVTITAQIAATEASGRDVSTGNGVGVAGRMPALRVPRTAGGPCESCTGRSGAGGSRGTMPRRAGRQGCRPSGGGRGPAPDGPAGVIGMS